MASGPADTGIGWKNRLAILQGVGSQLFTGSTQWLVSQVGNIATATLAPVNLSHNYNVWSLRPRHIPPPDAIMTASVRGFIGDGVAQDYLSWHGIPWPRWTSGEYFNPDPETDVADRAQLWRNCAKATMAYPDVVTVCQLWNAGLITAEAARALLIKAGAPVELWSELRASMFTPIDPGILLVSRNRGYIDDNELRSGLKYGGYFQPQQLRLFDQLREALPTISDLVLFATRDLWDADVVRRRELFAEFPDGMRQWADKLGLFGNTNIPNPVGAAGAMAKWADAYWGSHWQNIAPTQAFTMFHRIRESRLQRYRDQGFDVQTYDIARLRQELKVSDYAKGDRDYLAAIAYTPMRLIDIRKALQLSYRANTNPTFAASIDQEVLVRIRDYDRAWAVEQFLDRGLHPDDAGTSADIALVGIQTEESEKIRKFEQTIQLKLVRDTLESYKVGTIDMFTARDTLTANGMTADGVRRALATIDIASNNSIVKSAIGAIKSDYMNGTLAPAEVPSALQRAGVTLAASEFYFTKWTAQRNRTRRTATTQQLLKWLEEGLITVAEVTTRLTNLGWSNADSLTMLREAQQHIVSLRGRTLAAAQRTRAQQAKELSQVAKDAQKVQKQAVLDLRSAMPRTSIQSWLRKGLVSANYARTRLLEQKWPVSSIELWIQEALPVTPTPRNPTNGQTQPQAGGNVPPAGP